MTSVRVPLPPRLSLPNPTAVRFLLVASLGLASIGTTQGQPIAEPAPTTAGQTDRPAWFRAHIAGGHQLRAAFLPTNLGSLLVSREGQPILTDGTEFLVALLRPLTGRDELVRPLLTAFGGFDGSIEFEIAPALSAATLRDRPRKERRLPPIAGCVRLHSDDGDTIATLRNGLAAALATTAFPTEESELGGMPTRCYRVSERIAISTPRVVDGDCLILVGDPAASAERYLTGPRPQPDHEAETRSNAPIHCHLELGSVFDYMVASDGMDGEEESFRAAGFMCLDRLTLSVQPIGPRVVVETEVALRDDQPRGIVEGWLQHRAGLPNFLHQIPNDEPDWSLGKWNLGKVCDAVIDAIDASGFEDVRSDRTATGLARWMHSLSPDYLQLGSMLPDSDKDWHGKFSIAFRIADTKAFDAALESMKPFVLLHEKEPLESEIQNQTWALPLFVIDPVLVRFGDFLMLTAGRDPVADMESIVAWTEANAPEGGLAPELRNERPPGMHGLGRVSLRNTMRSTLPGLSVWGLPERLTAGRIDSLVKRLEQAKLGSATWVAGYAKNHYRSRLIW